MFQASYTLNIHIVQVIAIWNFSEVCKKGLQLCRENPEIQYHHNRKVIKICQIAGQKVHDF